MPEPGARGRPRHRPRRPSLALPAALAVLAVLAACAPTRPEPELLRRYRSYSTGDTTGLVEVTAFSAPLLPGTDAPRLTEISRSAQAAYIRSVADRTATVAELQAALAAPVGVPAPGPGRVDRTRFRRRLVLSVERHGAGGAGGRAFAPASRIAWLRVALGLDSTARFTSWDRFVTRYDTVELGTMGLRQSSDRDGELSLAPPIEQVLGAGLEAARADRLDESLPLRERHASNGVLRPDSMILLQEGAAGADLVGNAAVEVELRVRPGPVATVHRFAGLHDAAGRARPADSVTSVRRELVRPADAGEDVTAVLRFEALVRSVGRGAGDATYSEGDDRVRFLSSSEEVGRVVLVPARELRTSVWSLADPSCRLVGLERPGLDPAPGHGELRFLTRAEARRFLRWLRERDVADDRDRDRRRDEALTAAGRALRLGLDAPLRASDLAGLRVRLHPLNWRPEGYSVCP